MRVLAIDENAKNVKRVLLDGKVVQDVVEADEEAGYIVVVTSHDMAWERYRQAFAADVMPEIKLTGKVVIEMLDVS